MNQVGNQVPSRHWNILYFSVYRAVHLIEANTRIISVTKGEVSIKLEVSPDMAPLVQVVVYAGLPSENIIAHKADFDTEKCFANKVSVTAILTSIMTNGMLCIL